MSGDMWWGQGCKERRETCPGLDPKVNTRVPVLTTRAVGRACGENVRTERGSRGAAFEAKNVEPRNSRAFLVGIKPPERKIWYHVVHLNL